MLTRLLLRDAIPVSAMLVAKVVSPQRIPWWAVGLVVSLAVVDMAARYCSCRMPGEAVRAQ